MTIKLEFEHIPAYVLDYVKNQAEAYIDAEPEASDKLGLPLLIDDILFAIEEHAGYPEEQIAHLFVLWTNLTSAIARLDILVAARKQRGNAGISG